MGLLNSWSIVLFFDFCIFVFWATPGYVLKNRTWQTQGTIWCQVSNLVWLLCLLWFRPLSGAWICICDALVQSFFHTEHLLDRCSNPNTYKGRRNICGAVFHRYIWNFFQTFIMTKLEISQLGVINGRCQ